MEYFNKMLEAMNWRPKEADNTPKLQAIDGSAARKTLLPTHKITYRFLSFDELKNSDTIQLISEELSVPSSIVREDLERLEKGMKKKMTVCLEYPYVDEYYRDTYYSYYARKHSNYNRFCIRLSFFSNDVTENNFYTADLDSFFYGYMVLRPTPKRIVGYTFLSPKIYSVHNFVSCLCERAISVKGRIIKVQGFPFCGQDGEMNTCSETAVSIIFDYFSRRYNKYSRLLPSQIYDCISRNTIERTQPSQGIDSNSVVSIMRAKGMNTRLYVKETSTMPANNIDVFDAQHFKKLLHIYIESGFPIYAVNSEHAFVIIGRGTKLFSGKTGLVIMNDNRKPYLQKNMDNEITEFVVPMSENILLDANKIDPTTVCESIQVTYTKVLAPDWDKMDVYHRIFLTTSRSFKMHVVNLNLSGNLSAENRDRIVSITMPRFVWVCETFKTEDGNKTPKDIDVLTLAVFDTTEVAEGYNHLLFLKTQNSIMVPSDNGTLTRQKEFSVYESKEQVHPFMNNLKGEHNNWQI